MALSGWDTQKSQKITVAGTSIEGDLTDFPLYIPVSSGTDTSMFDELTISGSPDSYTKFLIHPTMDLSNSRHSVTFNGDPEITSSIAKFNKSLYIDGNDYVGVAGSSDLDFGTGDFTVDWWEYRLDSNANRPSICRGTAQYMSLMLGWSTGGQLNVYMSSNGSSWDITGTPGQILNNTVPANQWVHYAVVRSGNNFYTFANGVQKATWTSSASMYAHGTGQMDIGRYFSSYYAYAHMENIRFTKGKARWVTSFSGTLPTSSGYENDGFNTFMLYPVGDVSQSNHNITCNGVTVYPGANGIDYFYTPSELGQYVSIPDDDDWNFGSGDFTVDFWARYNGTPTGAFFGQSGGGGGNPKFAYYIDNISSNNITLHTSTIGNIYWSWPSGNRPNSTWNHYAFVRSGNNWYIFVDGTMIDSVKSQSGSLPDVSSDLRFMTDGENWQGWVGYMTNIRVSKGIARWTSNFTPPYMGPYATSFDNARKIAIADSSDTEMYVEIADWDPFRKKADLFTKVPTLTSGTDKELFLYYDSEHTTNSGYVGFTGDTTATGVWDNNFVGVYHMSQSPIGSLLDSSSFGRNATSNGSMTPDDLIIGNVSKAIAFDGVDDSFTTGSLDYSSLESSFTIEVKQKFWQTPDTAYERVCQIGPNSSNSITFAQYNTSNYYNVGIYGDDVQATESTLDVGNWHVITSRLSGGSNLNLFKNGVKDSSVNSVSVASLSSAVLNIADGGPLSEYAHTYVEEFRLSNSARADGWIKTTYNNIFNPTDMLTFEPAGAIVFFFSNPDPEHNSTAYGTSKNLQITVTVSGAPTYDATFYTGAGAKIGTTNSGITSGSPTSEYWDNTPYPINYSWYVMATASGVSDNSQTYTFTNRYLCSGTVNYGVTPISGSMVRAYRRDTGALIDSVTTGSDGTFIIGSTYSGTHFAVAHYPDDTFNALIYDFLETT
jgi:hypothetical protein